MKGHWGGGEVGMQGRAGLLFPLGQTSLYTACLPLFYKSTKTVVPVRLRRHTREMCQLCSVVLLEFGYKVMDQRHRFVRCKVC